MAERRINGTLTVVRRINGQIGRQNRIGGSINRAQREYATVYEGPYTVTPLAHYEQTLETANKTLVDDVRVLKVPYYETSNLYDGITVYIAEDINNG